MRRRTGLFLILVIAFTASAAPVDISGKVFNQNDKPVGGAIVTLPGQKVADTTDAQGLYSIKLGQFTAAVAPLLPSTERISLNNGIVFLSLTKPAPVAIDLFDMKGNLLERSIEQYALAGEYRFDLMAKRFAANFMVIRVAIERRASFFRYLPLSDRNHIITSFIAGSSSGEGRGLAKIQSGVDSLKAWAPGYLTMGVPISSYQGVVNIKLDTIPLDRFSFFVTSLKAIQELSGNQNGFGGDFRFGKTGPGAGLLGADSICQCIAERSMQGSKVKMWRAFLSVSKDVNGKQVNAIDRIGKGPWYDRVGKLLAPTLADLLNTRPMNGNADIKNDLPNEYGVPNHRPDPSKPEVDNHHFVTGSGADGKLYASGTTCEDWTSVTAGGKPRCGFSWPRGGGGGMGGAAHWISGFNAYGCQAGIEIVQNGAGNPSNPIIGGGGGYGGFYCFALNP